MRFNSGLAMKYRKNGSVYVAYELGYYDIFIQRGNSKPEWFDTFPSRGKAVKEAKRIAMEEKLGFDPDIDVV